MSGPLRVMFLSAEAAPLVKVGGLGDVAGSLPGELLRLPEKPDVRVFLPYYPAVRSQVPNPEPTASFEIAHQDGSILGQAYRAVINQVPYYFIDGSPIGKSPGVYSGNNLLDGAKFAFFSLAAMELARILDWKPDLIHAHDWHASPAVYHLSRIKFTDDFFKETRSLLTVHNLPYLGEGAEKALAEFGLPPARHPALPDWTRGFPLVLGLSAADRINTVSPGYAGEMLTAEFGAGLEGFLRTRKDDLSGILNGLDLIDWDPMTDPALPNHYAADSLGIRQKNKLELQAEVGLQTNPETPLLAMINRMDAQKGVDLALDALRLLDGQDWQALILGTGDPALEAAARTLANDYPQVSSVLKYDGALARRIYGGSDIILIPSRYEPCGLTQMIGMRYGCVPVARATGGLKDTITDYRRNQVQGTGFLFDQATPTALADTIKRSLLVFKDKRRWRGLQRRGMKRDFSWGQSARKYISLYNEIAQRT